MTTNITRSSLSLLPRDFVPQNALDFQLEIIHTDLLPGGDIHNLPMSLRAFVKLYCRPGGIGCVDVITGLLPITEEGKSPLLKGIFEEHGDNACILLIILPRTIVIEGTNHQRVNPKRGDIGAHK